MQHPYEQVAPIFANYWATAQVKVERRAEALRTGERLLRDLAVYQQLETDTRVPALWTMCTNERESGGDLNTYLGNGDPLHSITRDVPRGRGPFPTWPAGAKDALTLDGVTLVPVWNATRACFEWVLYNGWGYGTASPYLLGGTDLQVIGKFESDGHYNGGVWDKQLGCFAIAWGIVQHMPQLALPADTETMPADDGHVGVPITIGGSHHDTKWLQAALNEVVKSSSPMRVEVANQGGPDQLGVDGNYGRETRIFVRAFEAAEMIDVDRGFAGPQVLGKLDQVLGSDWKPPAA